VVGADRVDEGNVAHEWVVALQVIAVVERLVAR